MVVRKGSPWISRLERRRPAIPLGVNESADTVVVGGGIAGLSTAFHVLRDTDREVVLLEAGMIAHGATGNSAGQVVAAMERRFDDLTREFDIEHVVQGYREICSGLEKLKVILEDIGGCDGLLEVRATMALESLDMLRLILEDRRRWTAAGAPGTDVATLGWIVDSIAGAREMEAGQLASLAGTIDQRYIAVLCSPQWVLDTASLTEAMAEHLSANYQERFRIHERSRVRRLRLGDEIAATTDGGTVFADNVVLCTNGYVGMEIEACQVPVSVGNVMGTVGFMTGRYNDGPPASAVFLHEGMEGYHYLSRRSYPDKSIMAIGGPEIGLAPGERYDPGGSYGPEAYDDIDTFAKETLGCDGGRDMEWHGLIGRTAGGVRLIGPDPGNPHLMYNLGCNGIGILASLAGGWKVAQQMRGALFPPSMHDPSRLSRDQLMRLM